MLQLRSVCDVADNTGAKRAAIIGVLGEAKRFGEIGDIVKAHIKEAAPDGTVKKSEVVTRWLLGHVKPFVVLMGHTCVLTTTLW
jgi:ribosomal protein L14